MHSEIESIGRGIGTELMGMHSEIEFIGREIGTELMGMHSEIHWLGIGTEYISRHLKTHIIYYERFLIIVYYVRSSYIQILCSKIIYWL